MVNLKASARDPFLNYGLRKAREKMGISIEEASRKSGIGSEALEAYERLRCSPGQPTLDRLAKFYSLHPEEITPDPNFVRNVRKFREGYNPRPLREDLLHFDELDKNTYEPLEESFEDLEHKMRQLSLLKRALSLLCSKDRQLIELNYGLNGKKKLGLKKAGRRAYGMDITKQAVSLRRSNIHAKLSILMNLIKEWHLD